MNENNYLGREQLKTVLSDQWEAWWRTPPGIRREALGALNRARKAPQAVVISGIRRCGKSTLLRQAADLVGKQHLYYVNFEDERLLNLTAQDAGRLHRALLDLFGERRVFFLDEIQNLAGWERFVRRFMDQGFKFYITGSNASMLSRELGTRLTGRYIPQELHPFSFGEYLEYTGQNLPDFSKMTTVGRSRMERLLSGYLEKGGIPEALKYPELPVHQTLYHDILYRDIASRYRITEVRALKELAFYLCSNTANLISFNRLKGQLKLGSVNTVKNFIDHMEAAWLFLVVNAFGYSVKKQQIGPKKAYAIDNGLARSVAFAFSGNSGRYLENAVFLQLRRQQRGAIYYYKTAGGRELDFYLPSERAALQACLSLEDPAVRRRELDALTGAMTELGINRGLIVTLGETGEIRSGAHRIKIIPAYQWLAQPVK